MTDFILELIADYKFWIGVGVSVMSYVLISYLNSLDDSSQQSHPGCAYCKSGKRILTYVKGFKDETRIALYCPRCGKKLPKPKEDDEK